MGEEIKGEIKNIQAADYVIKCIKCGARDNLEMVAYRRNGYITGWLFTCHECFDELIGKEIVILE